MFEENIKIFKTRLTSRGYPDNLVDKILYEVEFAERNNTLTQKQKAHKKILPFRDTMSSITAMFEKYSNGKMPFW